MGHIVITGDGGKRRKKGEMSGMHEKVHKGIPVRAPTHFFGLEILKTFSSITDGSVLSMNRKLYAQLIGCTGPALFIPRAWTTDETDGENKQSGERCGKVWKRPETV